MENKENNAFTALYAYIGKKRKKGTVSRSIFSMTYPEKTVRAKYDTDYETDNGLSKTDKDYEKFKSIVFENLESHDLFEVNCKNLPLEIFCEGKKIV